MALQSSQKQKYSEKRPNKYSFSCLHFKLWQKNSLILISLKLNKIKKQFSFYPEITRFRNYDFFFLTCPLKEFGQIKQKVENGPCSRLYCVNQNDFK